MNYQLTIDSFIGTWGYSKQYVRSMLKGYAGKHVDVKISSPGGELDHGLDIRQQFIDHGDVTVHLSGFVASAATVIAMGAKRIVMSRYAFFLVHKCSNFIDAWGSYNADQMQKLIDDLEANKKENDKIDVVLAQMYANKCKKKVSEILDILKEGRWLNAQEALDYGFIDEIAEPAEGEQKLNITPEVVAKFNALGLSTVGLTDHAPVNEEQPVSDGLLNRIVVATAKILGLKTDNNDTNPSSINQSPENMKTYKFSKIEAELKLDSMMPDADGDVTVKAEQMETLNNRLDALDKEVADKTAEITAKDAEIAKLKEQVENLKKGPGDETSDIKDDGADSTLTEDKINDYINDIL